MELHIIKRKLFNTPYGLSIHNVVEDDIGRIIQVDQFPIISGESVEEIRETLEECLRLVKGKPTAIDIDFDEDYTPDVVDLMTGGYIEE